MTEPPHPAHTDETFDDPEPARPTDEQQAQWEAEYERFNPRTGHLAHTTATSEAKGSQLDAWTRHQSSLIQWDTLWTADHTADDWLLEPFIAAGRQHSIYAPAKAGKSLFVLDQVARLVTGAEVLDQPATTDPPAVLYLDMEMTPDDLRERLQSMGYGPGTDLSNLFYQSLPALPPLDMPGGGLEVLELADHYGADLVVIDTVSRVISGAENDADTMRSFYTHTGRPLKAAGRALLRLDHTGKDIGKGQRGTSAKADDVDVVYRLMPRDNRRFDLQATHRRMGWVPETTHLVQRDDPLRYDIAMASWPAGTKECEEALDRLGIPLEDGRRKAGQALRDADMGVRDEVVAAAVRSRRMRAAQAAGGNATGLGSQDAARH